MQQSLLLVKCNLVNQRFLQLQLILHRGCHRQRRILYLQEANIDTIIMMNRNLQRNTSLRIRTHSDLIPQRIESLGLPHSHLILHRLQPLSIPTHLRTKAQAMLLNL